MSTIVRGERSGWRMTAAALAVVAAAAHVPLTGPHLEEAPYIGVLFIALEVLLGVLAVALVVADSPWVWWGAAGASAMALVAYAVSRTVGLPQMADDIGNWTEPLGIVAVASEALLVLTALGRHRSPARVTTGSWRPALVGLLVLAAGLAATERAAAATTVDHSASMRAGMAMTGPSYWRQVAGSAPTSPSGVVRRYYISADLVSWDYAPQHRNVTTNRPFDQAADVFVGKGPGRIGSSYAKCVYRGYTDATFSHRAAKAAHLGVLGPVIRAAVGDTIKVVFRNACSFPASVHPHGVFYAKDSEGAPYADSTSGGRKDDDAVAPGRRHTYVWEVPGRAGPGPGDGSSVMWMYHSHTDEVGDTYAGLMGPMVVTRRGMARADGSPRDVDREVFASFFVDNENLSPLLGQSEKRAGTGPYSSAEEDEDFQESNLMHSVNGYVFGNMPMVTLHRGQHVRWYVMSMGTEVDLHTPHWHGNVVSVGGMRMDVVSLLPAAMIVADMVPDDTGTWLFHCHVNDHITAGMMARYRVVA